MPTVGGFFTPLPLEDAFKYQDSRKRISSRRFVAPSFNDVRAVLNTAQCMSIAHDGPLRLVTFDGDLTLYDDGESLEPANPVIDRILQLLRRGTYIGIVTAAGYSDPTGYVSRLWGLLRAVHHAEVEGVLKDPKLVIIGGECNYLCIHDGLQQGTDEPVLKMIPRDDWVLSEMKTWDTKKMQRLLDVAEEALQICMDTLGLDGTILRKEYAIGIIPNKNKSNIRFKREQLEETVLVTQQYLDYSESSRGIPFCVFNGGRDVFVDIGVSHPRASPVCADASPKSASSLSFHVSTLFSSSSPFAL